MKILLIGLFTVAAIIVVAVVLTGYMLPQRHVVTRSALYKASPDQLFTMISGPQNWRSDVKKFEVLPGSSVRQVRETTNSGDTITYEIVASDPPRTMVRKIADKGLPYGGTWTYRIEAEVGQSRLYITEDGEIYNPVFRFVSRFVLGHSKTIDDYLRNLGSALGQSVDSEPA